MTRSNISFLVFSALAILLSCTPGAYAFPRKKSIDSNKTRFSRERVKLNENSAAITTTTSSSIAARRELVLKADAIIGVIYASAFFLFPAKTLNAFFKYDFDPSIQTFLKVAVRMIALNHMGYIAGLLTSPPEAAIRTATIFLVIGGASVVYFGQLYLDTQLAFWSCTVLTTALILAHISCL